MQLPTEWEFAAEPRREKTYPALKGPEGQRYDNVKLDGRVPIYLNNDGSYLQNDDSLMMEKGCFEGCKNAGCRCHEMIKKAKLMRVEMLGLRIYTGPAFEALNNGSLRSGYYKRGKRDCLPAMPKFDDMCNGTEFITLSVLKQKAKDISVEMHIDEGLYRLQGKGAGSKPAWPRVSPAEYLNKLFNRVENQEDQQYFSDPKNITREEFDEFLKYEAGCGRRDYGACKNTRECATCKKAVELELDGNGLGAATLFSKCRSKIKRPCSNCAPGTDAFTHTVAAINSALRKLSKVTPLAPTVGVKWGEGGSQRPPRGQEIEKKELAAALAQGKLEFSPEELDKLKASNLSQVLTRTLLKCLICTYKYFQSVICTYKYFQRV